MPANFKTGLKTIQEPSIHTKDIFTNVLYIFIFIIFLFRQYTSNVEEKEKCNVKELITAKNSVVPYLTEQDILEVLFGPQSEMKP